MVKCEYCGRDQRWTCANTRDMTDKAIFNDDICYEELRKLGGGEQGMRYVNINRMMIHGSDGHEFIAKKHNKLINMLAEKGFFDG